MTLFPVFHPACSFVFSVVIFFWGGGRGVVFVWYFPLSYFLLKCI